MLCELFRITSHLVWYGTFAQDLGAMSPVFYMFTDRERAFDIVEAITRRPHAPELVPHRRRGAGPAARAGTGWSATSSTTCRRGCDEYDRLVMQQPHLQGAHAAASARTRSTRRSSGASPGPGLRACGFEWDFRKKRPYSRLRAVRVRRPDRRSTATATTARSCASRRCARACGSSSSACDNMPAGPVQVRPPAGHAAAARSARCTTSRR